MMEYENLMYGENANALYKLQDVLKNRKIKKPFYPIDNLDYSTSKNKRKEKLTTGEIRIIGVDVALMGKVFAPHISNDMMKIGLK